MVKSVIRKQLRKVRAARPSPPRHCESCGYMVNTDITHCPACLGELPPAGKAPRAPPRHIEDDHQQALFDWAKRQENVHAGLAMLYAVPNGGARNPIEAARLKAQGVKVGVLDINLDCARGGYFGLRIELKSPRAALGRAPRVSPEQRWWLAAQEEQGFMAVVCEGWDAARIEILKYLAMTPTVRGQCT